MTFEELSATQGTPANDTFAYGAMAAPIFVQLTPGPAGESTEAVAPPE